MEIDINPEIAEAKTDHLRAEMKELHRRFPTVMKDDLYSCKAFKRMPYKEINMDETVKASYCDKVRLTPIHLRKSAHNYINILEAMDIIERSNEPTEWCY